MSEEDLMAAAIGLYGYNPGLGGYNFGAGDLGGAMPDKESIKRLLSKYNATFDPGITKIQNKLGNLSAQGANAVGRGYAPASLGRVGRFAAGPMARNVLRALPAVGALYGVSSVGNVLLGPESGTNKLMDTAAMGAGTWGGIKGAAAGAAAGSVVPVLGTTAGAIIGGLAGAGLGKMGSDSLQWLFGDKKTPEQRKLEEALALLQGGMI